MSLLTVIEDNLPGCGCVVENSSHAMTLHQVIVLRPELKHFVNWLNARPRGYVQHFNNNHIKHVMAKQNKALSMLRQTYYSQHRFTSAAVYRGVYDNQISIIQEHGEQAVVFMWKKNESRKIIHTAILREAEFATLDPSQWSIVILYNEDGGISAGRDQKAPQPKQTEIGPVYGQDDGNKPDLRRRMFKQQGTDDQNQGGPPPGLSRNIPPVTVPEEQPSLLVSANSGKTSEDAIAYTTCLHSSCTCSS